MTNNTPITTNNDFPPFHRYDKRTKARGRYPLSKRYRGSCPTVERVKMLEKHTRRNRQRAKDRDAKSSRSTTTGDDDHPHLALEIEEEYERKVKDKLLIDKGLLPNPAKPKHFWAHRPNSVNCPWSSIYAKHASMVVGTYTEGESVVVCVI